MPASGAPPTCWGVSEPQYGCGLGPIAPGGTGESTPIETAASAPSGASRVSEAGTARRGVAPKPETGPPGMRGASETPLSSGRGYDTLLYGHPRRWALHRAEEATELVRWRTSPFETSVGPSRLPRGWSCSRIVSRSAARQGAESDSGSSPVALFRRRSRIGRGRDPLPVVVVRKGMVVPAPKGGEGNRALARTDGGGAAPSPSRQRTGKA